MLPSILRCARKPAAHLLTIFLTLVAVTTACSAQQVWPGSKWAGAKPAVVGVDPVLLAQGVNYAKSFGGSGMVVRNGRRIAKWGSQTTKYQLYSATKSFGSIMLGLAIADLRTTLATPVQPTLPELGVPPANVPEWLPLIQVEHLATHSAGFDKPGGYVPLLFQPGTLWSYSDSGANWLADYLTVLYLQDLAPLLQQRVLTPIGVSSTAWSWRKNRYREKTLRGFTRREFGAGIFMNVDAMARVGLLLARRGLWQTQQVLPAEYVGLAGRPAAVLAGVLPSDPVTYPDAPGHYGLLFWNNADGVIPGLPADAMWAWGLNEQLILAVPSLDLVVTRAGPKISTKGFGNLAALAPFFGPIAQAVAPAPPPPPPAEPPAPEPPPVTPPALPPAPP